MAGPQTQIMIQRMADITIIDFMHANVLDQVIIERIKAEIYQIVDQAGVPKIIINFANVQHVSSAVLGMLMSVNKKVKEKAGELRLAAISNSIMEVFKLTRLDKVLKIYKNTDDALVKF